MLTIGKYPIKFNLKKEFKDALHAKPVNWGYGGLSEFTFYRTYSRKKPNGLLETWSDCVIRVIEGMFSILKTHAITSHLPWDEKRAHKLAEEAATRLFEFKWTPPGRGLWMMGTDYLWEKGAMALYNPLHEDTKIFVKGSGWTPIKDIEGQEVEVYSKSRSSVNPDQFTGASGYYKATISEAEYHKCYEIIFETNNSTFANEYKVIASENHRWFTVTNKKLAFSFKNRITTKNLKAGMYIPRAYPRNLYELSPIGVAHGYFFGDGTRSAGRLHQFTDENKEILNKYFPEYMRHETNNNKVLESGLVEQYVKNCPEAWGYLPTGKYLKDKKYLMGFLAGYFAADGSVGTSYKLCSSRYDEIIEVQKLFENLGIETKLLKSSSNSTNLSESRELWELRLNKYCLNENFFIKTSHLSDYNDRVYKAEQGRKNAKNYLKIKSIKELKEKQRVLCATVPETENFLIEGYGITSNCSFVSTDNIDADLSKPFAFVMDTMMQGVGCGYDTDGAGKVIVRKPQGYPELVKVEDTREGWVELISCLIDSYLEEGSLPVTYDVSAVRTYGAEIKGFGGVASGPEPLIQGFNGIKEILDKRDGQLLTSTDIVSIMGVIGKIVVAGNVRRSALLALGSPEDNEYVTLKNWDNSPVGMGIKAPEELEQVSLEDYEAYNSFNTSWDDKSLIAKKYASEPWSWKFGGYLWASNNSLYAKSGMDYTPYVDSIAQNGEPGFFWLDTARSYGRLKDGIKNDDMLVKGLNPCAEIQLESYETCNLNENYPANHKDYWDFQRTLKFSYLFSKAVTLLATNWEDTNSVINRNRRIGCSVSGIQEAFVKFGRQEFLNWLDQAYVYLDYLDKKYSDWLGVPRSIRKTTVKPSGTVSLLAGALPGIHHTEATSYYRLVRIAANSPIVGILASAGYKIEPAASDPTRTLVVYFPVLTDEKLSSKASVSIWRQFKDEADVQKVWADNAVSITVTFRKEEVNQIADCLSAFDSELKSVSLLPYSEHGYVQAPYTAAPRDEVTAYAATLRPLDFSVLTLEGENAESNKFCSNEGCEI
jgi:ribonucleoside-triphosphate reductase (thioredoxin)